MANSPRLATTGNAADAGIGRLGVLVGFFAITVNFRFVK
jgi:hypothetical protein